MTVLAAHSNRFETLLIELESIAATKRYVDGSFISGHYVDDHMLKGWRVKARTLLASSCGSHSEHFKDFIKYEEGSGYSTNHDIMLNLKSVFEAAREDYNGGHLSSLSSLVQAELFSDELDQARELMRAGYHVAAAVIAGVVLETTLRQLCTADGLDTGKLDKMNADLAKSGKYNLLVQKRITALADIRNNAAHGNLAAFSKDDVAEMLRQVEAFVADQL